MFILASRVGHAHTPALSLPCALHVVSLPCRFISITFVETMQNRTAHDLLARGTCLPAPVSEKKVLEEESNWEDCLSEALFVKRRRSRSTPGLGVFVF